MGALGGLLFQIFVLPYLVLSPWFEKFEFIKILKEKQIIVNPKEEIIIQENTALEKAIEKVEKSVIAVQTETAGGKTLEGSALVLTSDGLVITLAELVPSGSEIKFIIDPSPSVKGEGVIDNEKPKFQVLKKDIKNNLALIKLEKNDLTTCGFSDFEKIKLGKRVFLIAAVYKNKIISKIANEGIIRTFDDNFIKTNIFDKAISLGSPLFDIEGRVLGLNFIDSDGKISAISIQKIKTFAGF